MPCGVSYEPGHAFGTYHVLRAIGNQVAHRRRIAALHVRTEELAALRKADGVEPTRELRNRGETLAHTAHLLVHVAVE